MQETRVQSLGREDPLEKEMATHSSTHAWKIPWMEKPGGLQSMGSQRVGHDWVTSLSFTFTMFLNGSVGKESAWEAGDTGDVGSVPGWERSPGEGNGNPLQGSCLENPIDRGTWRATVRGVTKHQTWLIESASEANVSDIFFWQCKDDTK